MTKRFTIDYYDVQTADGVAFEEYLRKVIAKPDDSSRNVSTSIGPIRIKELGQDRNSRFYAGDFTRIRLDDPVMKASLDGSIEGIPIGDDEGLGEATAFLYDPGRRIFVYQRNREGVSAARASHYFMRVTGIEHPLQFLPILRPEAYKKIEGMSNLRKFRVRLAAVGDHFASGSSRLMPLLKAARTYDSPSIEITMSMGHQKGGLNQGQISEMMSDALEVFEQVPEAVPLMRIAGNAGAGPSEEVDCFHDRLTDQGVVELSDDPSKFYERRRNALRLSYKHRSGDLRDILGR